MSQNLCGSGLLCNPSLQRRNYLDHMEPPFSPRLPADTWSVATAEGLLTKAGECQALALLSKIFPGERIPGDRVERVQ